MGSNLVAAHYRTYTISQEVILKPFGRFRVDTKTDCYFLARTVVSETIYQSVMVDTEFLGHLFQGRAHAPGRIPALTFEHTLTVVHRPPSFRA